MALATLFGIGPVGASVGLRTAPAAVTVGSVALPWQSLLAQCGPSVHPITLAAVVRKESGGNPWAININGPWILPRQPHSLAEAVATARLLLDRSYNFDAGLGQVNSRNFQAYGLDVPDVFNPCRNLAVAARILQDCYRRAMTVSAPGQAALQQALSCYNTGSLQRGIENGYVRDVVAEAGSSIAAASPILPKPNTASRGDRSKP